MDIKCPKCNNSLNINLHKMTGAELRSLAPSGPTPHIMALKGLRIAFASETDEGRRFSPGQVKWYSGGDTLKGRDLNAKDYIDFEPTLLSDSQAIVCHSCDRIFEF